MSSPTNRHEDERENIGLVHNDFNEPSTEEIEIEDTNNSDDEDYNLDAINTGRSKIVVGGGRFTMKRNDRFNPDDITGDLHDARTDTFRGLLSRILYSKAYWAFYVIMMLVSLFLLIWNIYKGGHERQLWFTTLEGIITALLIIELSLRIYMERLGFFYSWLNWADLIIIMLCTLSFGMYIRSVHNSTEEEVEEFLDVALIVLRYTAQALRILVFLRTQQKRKAVKEQYIDLNDPAFQPDAETPNMLRENPNTLTPGVYRDSDIELAEHDTDDEQEYLTNSEANKHR